MDGPLAFLVLRECHLISLKSKKICKAKCIYGIRYKEKVVFINMIEDESCYT